MLSQDHEWGNRLKSLSFSGLVYTNDCADLAPLSPTGWFACQDRYIAARRTDIAPSSSASDGPRPADRRAHAGETSRTCAQRTHAEARAFGIGAALPGSGVRYGGFRTVEFGQRLVAPPALGNGATPTCVASGWTANAIVFPVFEAESQQPGPWTSGSYGRCAALCFSSARATFASSSFCALRAVALGGLPTAFDSGSRRRFGRTPHEIAPMRHSVRWERTAPRGESSRSAPRMYAPVQLGAPPESAVDSAR